MNGRRLRSGVSAIITLGLMLIHSAAVTSADSEATPSGGSAAQSAGPSGGQPKKMTPFEITGRINFDPQCTNYAITGYCYCGYTPCAWHVVQYVPAAFIETTRFPGDTMVAALDFSQLTVGAANTASGKTRQINQEGMDNTYETHSYSIAEKIYQYYTACMMCKPKDAEAPDIGTSNASSGSGGGMMSTLCGGDIDVTSRIGSFAEIGGGMQGYSMKLYYASEADALNWRTGCRDATLANLLASNPATCTASGIADSIGGGDALSGILGNGACIGKWGPLYPRQMRTRGPTQVLSAAIAAYRGISIARTATGSFPFPVDSLGKLQQAHPAMSKCVFVGTLPLPNDMKVSRDGAYGWIYWRPTTCCIPFGAYATCYGS